MTAVSTSSRLASAPSPPEGSAPPISVFEPGAPCEFPELVAGFAFCRSGRSLQAVKERQTTPITSADLAENIDVQIFTSKLKSVSYLAESKLNWFPRSYSTSLSKFAKSIPFKINNWTHLRLNRSQS